jgi:hypothetical protein
MAKEQYIQVMRLDAQGLPKVEVIDNDLKTFQDIVGGYIEVVTFYYEGGTVLCIINEEGKLNGSRPNFAFPIHWQDKTYYDIIFGDVLFVGEDGEEFRGLNRDEIEHALKVTSEGREALFEIALNQGRLRNDSAY